MSDVARMPDGRTDRYPAADRALFEGLRWRRIAAFLVDAVLIAILTFIAGIVVFFLGVFTLGLGWILYVFLWQAVALLYTAFTLGGPNSATPGMRLMGVELRLWYGAPTYPLLAVVHALLFWFSMSLLTPLVLVVSLLDERKRLLHDLLLGTVMVDSAAARGRA